MSTVPHYCLVRPLIKIENPGQKTLETTKTYVFPRSWLGMPFTPEQIELIEDNIESVWKPYDISIDLNNKKLLIQRISGYGDFLFLSPIIKYIKEKYPQATIGMACAKDFQSIFEFIDGVDNLHIVPVSIETLAQYDYHLSVMGLMEGGHETDDNVYTLWFNALGATDIDMSWKSPKLKEITPLAHPLLNSDFKYFGIQPFALSPIRDLHIQMVIDILPQLRERGYTPLLFIAPGDKRLNNLAKVPMELARYSFEYVHNPKDMPNVIRLAKHCKWFLACDSLFAHAAPAMGINTVSIYGPFSAASRVAYYRNSWAIDTMPNCRCRAHSEHPCPNTNIYPSPCANISPKLILDIVDKVDLLNKSK